MLLWGCLLAACGAPASAQQLEQAVKASFLFKFAPFVEWPANALGAASRPFTICIGGEDPFGRTLDEVVRGQRISGRPVAIRRLGDSSGLTGCQMLFVGKAADFSEVDGQPVLTVSDRKHGQAGAMIQFVMQGGRVRFQIDNGMARAHGLSISSKLLGLAVAVDGK